MVLGQRQTAQLKLKYKNRECVIGVLPTDIPITNHYSYPGANRATVTLDTREALGDCWNLDVSSGEETMVMELKLPFRSPIAVSKVKIIDDSDPQRCWTSNWRSGYNYNRQTNQWVAGTFFVSNNFDGNCT